MTNIITGLVDPLGEETARLVEEMQRSVVVVYARDGHGAGVVWDRNGLIVTNDHVAPRGGDVTVELPDERRLRAAILARDRENDLALLHVDARDLPLNGLPIASIGDSAALRVGEIVLAVGHPRGVRGTATLGIVSAGGGATWMGRAGRDVLQADIVLAPGNSGGPLINTRGEVVGIAHMILAPGIALAVPSRTVAVFVARHAAAALRRAA
ncbi:MAG: trypsin-like peptidase domain-containing protein [Armatimonadetes bacterium]|nr:trypsin-like peptidase domain-containing protein [Armatimonadota bacterium]